MSGSGTLSGRVPAVLDDDFLEWLRRATETTWRSHVPRDFKAAGVGGLDWQTGTRWRGGMTDAEIGEAEDRYGLRFPPDYRLLLATLHTPDPPMVGARFVGTELVPSYGRLFHDWTGDPEPIQSAIAWPLDALLWSIEHDESWHPSWGPRPRGKRQREALLRQSVEAGPQLVPVLGHRYLVGPPDRIGNPVLSIYGADVIVYGSDLRSYLLAELDLDPLASSDGGDEEPADGIPFWQDVIDGLPWYFA